MSRIRSIEGQPIEVLVAGAVLEHWLETSKPATRSDIADLLGITRQRLNGIRIDDMDGIERGSSVSLPEAPAWIPTREHLRRELVNLRQANELLLIDAPAIHAGAYVETDGEGTPL